MVSAPRSASGEGELAVVELEMFEVCAVKGRFQSWDQGLDAVGFDCEVEGPDCDAVLVNDLRSGGILIEVVKGDPQ